MPCAWFACASTESAGAQASTAASALPLDAIVIASLVKSGLFLEQFRTVPWAHLDIGGTAYFRKATSYATRGATGVTHATLVELAPAGAQA